MQVWGTNAAGGFMYSDQLSNVIRSALQPMSRFQQHCDAEDFTDKGYGKGLNGNQEAFARTWRGGPVLIVRTPDDARVLVNEWHSVALFTADREDV